jgi:dienelactone hydrolase
MNKLLCDKLSDYLPRFAIIAPNFFIEGNILGDDPLKERGFSLMKKLIWPICCCKICGYIKKYSWDNVAGDVFDKTTNYLLDNAVRSFFPIGFCWGSYVGFRACGSAQHRDRIVGNISCHPSVSSIASMLSEKESDILDAVTCPQLIAATRDEPVSWKPNGAIQKYFASKPFGNKCEYYNYDESHGFVTRGDTTAGSTREAIADCLDKIVNFIRKLQTI